MIKWYISTKTSRTVVCQRTAGPLGLGRTGPKKILEDLSGQDLKIDKRTSKDLFFDSGTIIRFSKWLPWNFNDKPT